MRGRGREGEKNEKRRGFRMTPSIIDEIARSHNPPQKIIAKEETNRNKRLMREYVIPYE